MQFDDLFRYIGGFGAFQITNSLLLMLIPFLGTEIIFLNYVGYDMEHWCRVSDELSQLPYSVQKNVAIPYAKDDAPNYDSCHMFNLNYSDFTTDDFLHWNRSQHSGAIQPCVRWVYDKSVMVDNTVSDWNLVCSDLWKVDFASSMSIVGNFIGSWMNGALTDRVGRRVMFLVFLFMKVIASGIYTAAGKWSVFIVARLVNGIGSTGVYLVAFVLIVETVGPRYRNTMGIAVALSYSFGFMAVPGFAYFFRDATRLQLVTAVLPVYLVVYFWIIPESPRWLLLTGRHKDAERVVRFIADVNQKKLPENFSIKDVELEAPRKSKGSYSDLFRHPQIRRRTLILCANWFTDSLLYYALSLNAGTLSGNVFLNTFLLGAVEVPAITLAMFLTSRPAFGRKYSNFMFMFGAGIACLTCIPLIILDVLPMLVTALALVGKAGSSAGFAVIYQYSSELYPTELRSVGLGACAMFSRISGVLAPYVGGPLANIWRPLPELLYGVFGTMAGLLNLLLPDTLNKPLPDTIADVEGHSRDFETTVIGRPEDDYSEEEMRNPTMASQTESINSY